MTNNTNTQTAFTINHNTAIEGYSAVTNRLGQNLYVQTDTLTIIERLLDAGSHVFLFGAAGTAKTELGEALLAARGKQVYQFEAGNVTSGDELDGSRTLDDNGKLVTVPSELLKGLRSAAKGNSVGILMDELNRVAAPAALNKLLRVLGSQREYATDLEGVLQVGTNASFIATANIGYHGTVRINEALVDRWDAIEMLPLEGQALTAMIHERYPSVPAPVLRALVRFTDNNRRAAENDPDGEIVPVTTRDALRIAKGISIGMTPVDAITRLVGGQLAIRQIPQESLESLVAEAKSQFSGL